MKSTGVAYLFWIVGGLGLLGLHRFYLGRWVTGLVWLLTGGCCVVGALVDLFALPSLVRVENLARLLLRQAASTPAGSPLPRPSLVGGAVR